MRKLLVGTLALAMVTAPAVALAHGGGGDNKGKHRGKPAAPVAAPVVTFTTIPCNNFNKPRKEFKIRGTVLSVAGNGFVVDIDKINGNFARAVGGTTKGGSYDATVQIAFGDCTRVKADGHGSHDRGGKKKNRGFALIAAGDKVKVEWKATKGTNVNALGAPNRIDVHKVGKKHHK